MLALCIFLYSLWHRLSSSIMHNHGGVLEQERQEGAKGLGLQKAGKTGHEAGKSVMGEC